MAPSSAPSPARTAIPTAVDATVAGDELAVSVGLFSCLGVAVLLLYSVLRNCARSTYSPRKKWVSEAERVPELPRGLFRWVVPLLHPSACDELVLRHVGLDAYMVLRVLQLGIKLFSLTFLLALVLLFPYYATLGSEANIGTAVSGNYSKALDQFTISYIIGPGTDPNATWWPALVVCLFTGLGLWLLHREYMLLVPLQREYYLTRHRNTYTVLVERIPAAITSRKALLRYFETIVPGTVRRVDLVPFNDTAKALEKAVEEREEVLADLERDMLLEHVARERAEAPAQQQDQDQDRDRDQDQDPKWRRRMLVFAKQNEWMGVRAFCYGRLCGCFGTRVDAVAVNKARLVDANELVASLQDKLKRESYVERDRAYRVGGSGLSPREEEAGAEAAATYDSDCDEQGAARWSFDVGRDVDEAEWLLGEHPYDGSATEGIEAAFVTFSSKTASTSVSRGMRTEQAHFSVKTAPEPRDVKWGALACNPRALFGARILVVVLLVVLLVLFGMLTSFLSVSTNVTFLRSKWPYLDQELADNPWLKYVWGQLGPLLLVICFAVVPPILNLILELRFLVSESDKENSFFAHYYFFLVTQIFLFFQISGAVSTLVATTWKNPTEFLAVLAETIPNNANFFMQYICIKALWVLPAELLRLPDAMLALLVRPIFCRPARTPRELHDDRCGCRAAFVYAGDAWHGLQLATAMLLLTIGVTYSVLAPLVLVFVLLYFCVALVIWRNQFLYVYVKKYESGGSMFGKVAVLYLCAFLLLQVTMLALFGISQMVAQSVLMLVPILVTLSYGCFMWSSGDNESFFVTLSDARRFDVRALAQRDTAQPPLDPLDYRVPGLRAPAAVQPTPVDDMLVELERLHGAQENLHPFQDDPAGEYLSVPTLFTSAALPTDGAQDDAEAGQPGQDVERQRPTDIATVDPGSALAQQ